MRRNAVDTETAKLLLDGYRSFEDDDEARVLVLTGAGELAFCAGADLKALSEADISDAGHWLDERSDGPLGFTRLSVMPLTPEQHARVLELASAGPGGARPAAARTRKPVARRA